MKSKLLVIVDVQPDFTRSRKLLSRVKAEILRARDAGETILFLEIPYHRPRPDEPYKPTYSSLTDLVDGYEKSAVWQKMGSDGSRQVIRYLRHERLEPEVIRICGVQTDLCVLATVKGLLRRTKTEIHVVKEACDTKAAYRRFAWLRYPRKSRLRFIEGEASRCA